MSARVKEFREEVSKIKLLFDLVCGYLDRITVNTNPDAKENGTPILATIKLGNGARNVSDYIRVMVIGGLCVNGDFPESIEVLEFPLEDVVHDISMFLKTRWALLIRLAIEMQHWLRLNIPKIDGGNDVGREIIESILSNIESFREKILAIEESNNEQSKLRMEILDTFYTCRKNRRKDIIRFLHTIDFDRFNLFEIHMKDILLDIDFIFDKCDKNMEKITNPRNNAVLDSMY